MYSCVFWCEFIELVVFWGLLLFDPCHFNQPKKPTKAMNSHQKTQEYIKGKSPLFIS